MLQLKLVKQLQHLARIVLKVPHGHFTLDTTVQQQSCCFTTLSWCSLHLLTEENALIHQSNKFSGGLTYWSSELLLYGFSAGNPCHVENYRLKATCSWPQKDSILFTWFLKSQHMCMDYHSTPTSRCSGKWLLSCGRAKVQHNMYSSCGSVRI